jgi:hypothetical protein
MQTTEPEERKWYLAARSLTSTLTPEEEHEWQQIMKDKTFSSQFERVTKYWNDAGKLPYLHINTEEDWHQVAGKIRSFGQVREHSLLPRLLKYAAAVAALVVVSVFVWKITLKS